MTNKNYPTGNGGGRSHLGAGSRITGDLYFPGTVELPGHIKGRVEASTVAIEETGDVEGEIHAASIYIRGQFRGKIVGGTVTLHSTAEVTGKFTYQSLNIESGARAEVQFRRQKNI
ncbi:MAG: polymer-forming cytoskeletal protein [Loktanella sp.]|nr:polymer-forming cytoskeletal protein [Loktanella sp.]